MKRLKRPKKNRKPKHKKQYWKPKKEATVTSLIAKGHEPKCKCCGSLENLTFDHVTPKSKGGQDSTKNGQVLCKTCNGIKGDRKITIETLRIEILNTI